MTSFFRKLRWWVQRRRKEDELREGLQFHLDEKANERQAEGVVTDQARWAARRDLGNVTLAQESTRALWTWTFLEQLVQDWFPAGGSFRSGLRSSAGAHSCAVR
jgi:hypothetical protein